MYLKLGLERGYKTSLKSRRPLSAQDNVRPKPSHKASVNHLVSPIFQAIYIHEEMALDRQRIEFPSA
jgi:hypothetical protein